MARIIPLHGGEHHDVQVLLPWYVTGKLDAADQTRVEAHLAACAECQADLRFEQRLEAGVGAMEPRMERDWSRLRARMAAHPSEARSPAAAVRRARRVPWVGWAIAAQFALILLLVGLQLAQRAPAEYRTLAARAPAVSRIIVTFRPDSREEDLRRMLNAVDARVVDGPTAANAYVLQTPAAGGQKALATLRSQPLVLMAEPLGPAGSR